ncbi:MAG: hypothetical protein ACM3N9_07495 [Syntrophothermus sp.]
MQPRHNSKITLWIIAGFMLAFFLSSKIFPAEKIWKHIVTSDGRGYYAYLPALLIDHDPTFSQVVEREKKLLGFPNYKPGYLVQSDGQTMNKYFSGEALLLLPFFLLGMLITFLTGHSMDGYSFFFQFFTGIGSLVYLLTGLNFIRKILKQYDIASPINSLVLVLILFGTNLFYYSIWQPTMSHVFSFFAVSAFAWYSICCFEEWKRSDAILMAFFFALVCLIRPTNGIVLLLLPFFAGNLEKFIAFWKNTWCDKKTTFMGIAIILLILAIQPVLWYIQTGRFFVWSYADEGFHFSSPEIHNVLFSFRKGLFVYTPLILVTWLGIIRLFFRNRLQFFSMLAFLVVSTYIISCWWSWYYGDGFGLRAFIDYYGIYAILLGVLLQKIHSRVAIALLALAFLPLVYINLFQSWQYSVNIIQPNSMNKEKYEFVFMRSDSLVFYSLGGKQEIPDYSIDHRAPVATFTNDFEKEVLKDWYSNAIVSTPRAFSGTHAGYLDSVHPYSPTMMIGAKELGIIRTKCFVEGEVMVWDSLQGATNGALMVLSMENVHPGENWWDGFKLNDVPYSGIRNWRKCSFSLMLPDIVNPDGILKIYIWNNHKKPMLIDDFRIRFYKPQVN